MGDGLKRAFAAAARTRSDASLTPEMHRFLTALARYTDPLPPAQMPMLVTREQDRARQRCRRFGYANMAMNEKGKRGWIITPLGRKMLSSPSPLVQEGRE